MGWAARGVRIAAVATAAIAPACSLLTDTRGLTEPIADAGGVDGQPAGLVDAEPRDAAVDTDSDSDSDGDANLEADDAAANANADAETDADADSLDGGADADGAIAITDATTDSEASADTCCDAHASAFLCSDFEHGDPIGAWSVDKSPGATIAIGGSPLAVDFIVPSLASGVAHALLGARPSGSASVLRVTLAFEAVTLASNSVEGAELVSMSVDGVSEVDLVLTAAGALEVLEYGDVSAQHALGLSVTPGWHVVVFDVRFGGGPLLAKVQLDAALPVSAPLSITSAVNSALKIDLGLWAPAPESGWSLRVGAAALDVDPT
jgi:hypothetical protein